MLRHQLLSGETIEAPTPKGELADFIARLRTAVDDPTVDESAFIELLYSPENPLLDRAIMPGRGTVTKAVFADPTYHVMLDLLGRKRIALGSLDMEKVRARYSMTVKQAATIAGVHENAIRQAIAAKRLSSVKLKGEHRLDPAQVEAYKPSTRGPAAPLAVVYGSVEGKRLSIKHDGELVEEGHDGGKKSGHLDGWASAAVLAGAGDKARCWVIEPGSVVNEIQLDPFGIKGRFTIMKSTNNAVAARDLFKAFASRGQQSEARGQQQAGIRDVRVMPGTGGGWIVSEAGKTHRTKESAVEAGRKVASEHVIHNRDVRIAEKNSYPSDPKKPKTRTKSA